MATIQPGDPDFLYDLSHAILDAAVNALTICGQDVPERRYVALDVPPQDCCPELAVWANNLRAWDGTFPDGLQQNEITCFNLWAVDVAIRVGRCYVDFDPQGVVDPDFIDEQSRQVYRDGNILYVGLIQEWRDGGIQNLQRYDPILVQNLLSYNEGGCAGFEFTMTLGFM